MAVKKQWLIEVGEILKKEMYIMELPYELLQHLKATKDRDRVLWEPQEDGSFIVRKATKK